MRKILLLSGGSYVGQNILTALENRRKDLYIFTLNSIAEEPSLYDFDEVILVPSLVEEKVSFLNKFESILETHPPDLIIPCRDEDVSFLAFFAEQKPSWRNKILCGSSHIASSFLDKSLSYELSNLLELPFAPTISTNKDKLAISKFVEENGFPLIAKPQNGFASMGVKLLFEVKQLNAYLERNDYVLQRYLGDSSDISNLLEEIKSNGTPLFHSFEKTKISIQSSIGPNGEIGGVIVTEHHMKQGKSAQVSKVLDFKTNDSAKDWVLRFVNFGWRGPLNIQAQCDNNGELFIFEFNGRFTGATSARFDLGFDEVGLILKMWLGYTLESAIDSQCHEVFRSTKNVFLNHQHVKQLNENKVWKRSNLKNQE
jgi:carbamoylphosphate synthase large subunit